MRQISQKPNTVTVLKQPSFKRLGYTLIELMIVVTIIGILAAIAIPQYQNYVARSQITEAINLVQPARDIIEETVANGENLYGFITNPTSLLKITSGKYVNSITTKLVKKGKGIKFTVNFNQNCQKRIRGKTLLITVTASQLSKRGELFCSGTGKEGKVQTGDVREKLWSPLCRRD